MREIKFRFWDRIENAWMVDGRRETNIYDFAFREDMYWNFIPKEEAFILKDHENHCIGFVIYAPPVFCVKEKDKLDVEEWSNLGASKIYPDNWKLEDTEIIGNIYENPELIKNNS